MPLGQLNPNSPAYQANISQKPINQQYDLADDLLDLQEAQNFSFELYPNPTNGTTNIVVEGKGASLAQIFFYDITGKRLNVEIEQHENLFRLNVSNLAKGMYLVKVSSIGEFKTKQLLIK